MQCYTDLSGACSQTELLDQIAKMMGNTEGRPKYRYRKPKFIKLVSGDSGEGLPDAFFEDPYTFEPKPGPRGEVHSWGVFPYAGTFHREGKDPKKFLHEIPEDDRDCNHADGDMLRNVTRMMQQASYYFSDLKATPEEQFIKILVERKRQQLAKTDLGDLPKQDVILRIYMYALRNSRGEHRIWRRFRVSAGLKVGVFQDKVLCPVMGWARNMHSYTFTDFRDGSLFGPKGADSPDCITYRNQVGCEWLPDDEYMLAHILPPEGKTFGYLYDFGDRWYHDIVVEKILPVEMSDGQVEIIAGGGMCPGGGLFLTNAVRLLLMTSLQRTCEEHTTIAISCMEYDTDSDGKKRRNVRFCLVPNYENYKKSPVLFDVDNYDMEWAREKLAEALASSNSVRTGMRKFVMPMSPQGLNPRMQGDAKLKKGQTVKQTFSETGDGVNPFIFPGYIKETTSERKDSRSVSAYMWRLPSIVVLFKKEHQKEHWKSGHKKVCSRKFSQ
ncbi:hypothetical protein VNI00_010022 [Paramarasmius palmivorus]|uniref:Plasmid pRiA4b Orf3-like domain-containing protein n=1 Tax=Paramarasmius palmivorus TaxID=297713 RepID=A0AAW0CMP0_9AGAR